MSVLPEKSNGTGSLEKARIRLAHLLSSRRASRGSSLKDVCSAIGMGLSPSTLLQFEQKGASGRSLRLVRLVAEYNIAPMALFQDVGDEVATAPVLDNLLRSGNFHQLVEELNSRSPEVREKFLSGFVKLIRTMGDAR